MSSTTDESATLINENRRLKSQVRLSRTALGLVLLLAVIGAEIRAGHAEDTVTPRAPRESESIILEVPAVKQLIINSETIQYDFRAREYQLHSNSEVTWTNGVRLHTRNARVSILKTSIPEPGTDGATRVLIEPLSPASK